MAYVKVLARDWKIEIESGEVPSWIEIKGINSFEVAPTTNNADVTTFDGGGWQEHLVASRGRTITVNGIYLEDPDTGERDPGQQAAEELAEKIGHVSIGRLRLTSPAGKSKIYNVTAEIGGPGGGNDDPTNWSVTFTVSGKPEDDDE